MQKLNMKNCSSKVEIIKNFLTEQKLANLQSQYFREE